MPLPDVGTLGGGFPPAPDRSAWTQQSKTIQGAYSRALHLALESLGTEPMRWSKDGVQGSIVIEQTTDPDVRPVCRRFSDTLIENGQTHTVRDVSCWNHTRWIYIRGADATVSSVLDPAYADTENVYVVRSGGTLQAVARRTRRDLAGVQALNPIWVGRRLGPGEPVLLP